MIATEPETSPPRYRFAATDGTIWLGLRSTPVLALGVALSLAVAALYFGAPLPVAVLVIVIGLAVALVPIAGRVGVDWATPLGRYGLATASAKRCWSAGAPSLLTGNHSPSPGVLRLPREYGRLLVLPVAGAPLAVIDDPRARAVTAVLTVAGADRFALLGPQEQNARVTGWGTALAALAADPEIRRIQWVERAGPDRSDQASWLPSRAATVGADPIAVSDYTQMTEHLLAGAVRHEVWLAVQFARRDGGRLLADTVGNRVRDVTTTLLAADLLARPLTAADIAGVLRRFCDLTVAEETMIASSAGPSSRRSAWSELRTDDSWHRSFAITAWPRIPVPASWLAPLLATASAQATRTVSMHLQPVAPAVATREARAARTRARLDGSDRTRLGFTDAMATAWAEADAAGAEEELLAGYRLHRLSGVVTCSAVGPAELDEACRAVRTAATAARVDVRPLHGEHDLGFLASLPLCRTNGLAR